MVSIRTMEKSPRSPRFILNLSGELALPIRFGRQRPALNPFLPYGANSPAHRLTDGGYCLISSIHSVLLIQRL